MHSRYYFTYMETQHTLNLQIQVPDSAALDEQGLREYLAAKLYGDARLSLAEAAAMAGMKKWDFPNVLKRLEVSYFNLTPEELHDDIANARPRNI